MPDGAYNDPHRRHSISPLTAGFTGAVVGAAIGAGVAMFLSDPQKRKQMERKLQDMQKWGNKTLQELKASSDELQEELVETVADKSERIQKEIDQAAAQAQKTK